MRIISGQFKGKRITAPKNLPVRPTTDFAKEALFNILRNRLYIEELSILDLFSGIASISVEFLSRGVTHCTSVDQHFGCVKFMQQLKRELDLSQWTIIKADAFKITQRLNQSYDIVFADPPYDLEKVNQLPDLVFSNQLLKQDGLFILEHSNAHQFNSHPNFEDSKNYGNVNFTFFSP